MENKLPIKTAVILYHKDILNIYKRRWIEDCLDSIREQTYTNYVVYELCYSDTRQQWWEGSIYEHKQMTQHIFAMNYILDKAFQECDAVFNVNLDDIYHPERFIKQLEAIEEGYDLVSTDFEHIEEIDGNDKHIRFMQFHDRNIFKELNKEHNVLCHSVICYTKEFWEKYRYYDTNHLGFEDLSLWQRAAKDGCKITILPEVLCQYRLSPNQTGRVHKHIK